MPAMRYVIPECPECHYKMKSAGRWEGDVIIFLPNSIKFVDCPKCKKGKIGIPNSSSGGIIEMIKNIFR